MKATVETLIEFDFSDIKIKDLLNELKERIYTRSEERYIWHFFKENPFLLTETADNGSKIKILFDNIDDIRLSDLEALADGHRINNVE